MDSRQRVMAAIHGHEVDRCPWTALLSMYGAQLTGCPLETYYREPLAYCEGQRAVHELFSPDLIFAPFAFPLIGEAFGGRPHFLPDQAPNLAAPAMVPAVMEEAEFPCIATDPRLQYFRIATSAMSVDLGAKAMIAAPILGPVDLPIMVLGLEAWLDTFLMSTALSSAIVERASAFTVEWANAMLEDGADCCIMTSMFLGPKILPRELAASRALPVYERTMAKINGPVLLHHGGGRLLPVLDMLDSLPRNMVGAVLNCDEDLVTARKLMPDRLLVSGLDGPLLHGLTPSQVHAAARRKVEQAGGRFMLCSTSADVALNTPAANILAIRRAVEGECP